MLAKFGGKRQLGNGCRVHQKCTPRPWELTCHWLKDRFFQSKRIWGTSQQAADENHEDTLLTYPKDDLLSPRESCPERVDPGQVQVIERSQGLPIQAGPGPALVVRKNRTSIREAFRAANWKRSCARTGAALVLNCLTVCFQNSIGPSVGLAAKPMAPRVPLGVLLVATWILDVLVLAIAFALAGIGRGGSSGLPWSHGLFMSFIWALVAALLAVRIYVRHRSDAATKSAASNNSKTPAVRVAPPNASKAGLRACQAANSDTGASMLIRTVAIS